MLITEIKGKSQVFTLKDGNTLRLLSHQTKKVADSKVSEELRIAESMGLVLLSKNSTKVPNEKSGGSK